MTPTRFRLAAGKLGAGLHLGTAVALLIVLTLACDSQITTSPQELLLSPDDFDDISVRVSSASEEQSLDGPSALVELEGPDFRVLQSIIVFDSREEALAALDGIRADLISRGETGPGETEASGVFKDRLGDEEATGLFFIERNGLVRLAVTGPERDRRLARLADVARDKLSGG